MKPKFVTFDTEALIVGAGAVYPFSEALVEQCVRESRFGDPYSVCRVIGPPSNQRVLVPRNMAPGAAKDVRREGLAVTFTSSFLPRSKEQSRIVEEAVQLLAHEQSFMLEAPTGSGKTWMAVDIIAQVARKTLVVVTKSDIRDQWVAALGKLLGITPGHGIGFIQGDTCTTRGQAVVIAMVQSLAKENRYPESVLAEFGFCIFDECHRMAADFFNQACYRVPAKLRMGLSATPDRKDGKEELLYSHIGPILVRSEGAPLTPRIIAQRSPWHIPYCRKRKKDGTFVMAQIPHSAARCTHIVKLLSKHQDRNLMIARFVAAAYRKDRCILVQSAFIEHLKLLYDLFCEQGVPPGDLAYYLGGMSTAALTRAKSMRLILSTYSMTSEATDIPRLDTLVMATPKSDVRQIVGRVLRYHPDKKEPVVFDIIDATSTVFQGFWSRRSEWYRSIEAEVGRVGD